MPKNLLMPGKHARRMLGFTLCGLWWATTLPAQAQPPEPPPAPPKPIETVTMEQAQQLVGGPTLVTLNFDNATPQAVYEELFRQANITPRLSFPAFWTQHAKPVTVHFERKPFWEAMRELQKQTGLILYSMFGSQGYTLVHGEDIKGNGSFQRGPSLVSGPFQIAIGQTTISQNRPAAENAPGATGNDAGPRQFLTLQVMPDPKFDWSRVLDVQTEVAVDENGNSLLLPAPESKLRMLSLFYFTVPLYLAQPPGKNGDDGAKATAGEGKSDAGHKIARLKGKIRVVFASASETWELPDPLNSTPATKELTLPRGRENYTIQKIAPDGKNLRLTYTITSQTPARLYPDEFQKSPPTPRPLLNNDALLRSVHDSMSLVYADGTVHRAGSSGGGGSPGNWEYTVSFPYREEAGNQSPAKLIWKIPLEWKIVEVPFEFTDVPLPQVGSFRPPRTG